MAINDREHEQELRSFITWMREELDRGETIEQVDRIRVMRDFYALLDAVVSENLPEVRHLLKKIGETYDRWSDLDFGLKESGRFFDRFIAAWSYVRSTAEEMLDIESILGRGDLYEKYKILTRAEVLRSFSAFYLEKEWEEVDELSHPAWKLIDEQWEKFEPLGLTMQKLAYALYKKGPGRKGSRVQALVGSLVKLKEIIDFDRAFAEYTEKKLTGQGYAIPNLMGACLNLEAALAFYEKGDQKKLVWYHLERMAAIISRVGGGEKWKREMATRGEEVLIDI